jgi:hypothetical protein
MMTHTHAHSLTRTRTHALVGKAEIPRQEDGERQAGGGGPDAV